METRNRIKRHGSDEWLDRDGLPTTDATAAESFSVRTDAIIFFFGATEYLSLWGIEEYVAETAVAA